MWSIRWIWRSDFGVDQLRYFLLREISFGQDGSYSREAIVNRVNSELANSFGNLAQRSLSMIFKNLGGVLPSPGEAEEDCALLDQVRQACDTLAVEFDRFAFSAGLEAWMGAVFACNAYIDAAAPWALKKTDPERMAAVLGTLVVAVRELAEAVKPVIPASAEKLIALIDSGKDGAADRPADADFPAPRAGRGRGSGGMKLIDSHCHLNYAGLVERQDEVLANARARGIGGFLNISTRQSEWDEVVGAAERNDDVWASVGVHPHEADAHPDLGAAALVEAAAHPRVIAIGECGLDYYYDKSDRAAQRERFQAHIEAARATGLAAGRAHARCGGRHRRNPHPRSREGWRRRRAALLHRQRRPGPEPHSTSASTFPSRAS